jgi:hypothetical protein
VGAITETISENAVAGRSERIDFELVTAERILLNAPELVVRQSDEQKRRRRSDQRISAILLATLSMPLTSEAA